MKHAMWIFSVVVLMLGLYVCGTAKSAIHEGLAGIAALIAAVLWVGGGIVDRLDDARDALRKLAGIPRPPTVNEIIDARAKERQRQEDDH